MPAVVVSVSGVPAAIITFGLITVVTYTGVAAATPLESVAEITWLIERATVELVAVTVLATFRRTVFTVAVSIEIPAVGLERANVLFPVPSPA